MNITFHKIANRPSYAIYNDTNEMIGTIDCPLEGKWRIKIGSSLERDGFTSAGKARAWVEGYAHACSLREETLKSEYR